LIYSGIIPRKGVATGLSIGILVVSEVLNGDDVALHASVLTPFPTVVANIAVNTVEINPKTVIGAGPSQINETYTLAFTLAIGVFDNQGRVDV
jgi:hypothetical protein